MEKLVKDLITYLDGKFASDSSLGNKVVTGEFAYSNQDIKFNATNLKYVVEVLDFRAEDETFLSENTVSEPLQISIAGVRMKINNVFKTPQEVAYILGQKLIDFLDLYKFDNVNKNIVSMRRTVVTQPMKYNDAGTVYTTALRYNFILSTPYVSA